MGTYTPGEWILSMTLPLAPEFPKVGDPDFWRKAVVYEDYMREKENLEEWEKYQRLRGKYGE